MIDWIKENVVVTIVVSILLVIAGIGIVSSFRSSQQLQTEETAQMTSSSSVQKEPSSKEETVDEKNYRTAKLKLERPYAEARSEDKKEVLKAFEEAVADIKKTKFLPNVKGTIENHLSMTQNAMVQTFAMALLTNQYDFQPEQLEVMPTESDDVIQFLIVLTKNGEENSYFVGNFNTTVQQIQLKAYVGGNIGGTYG
ncbi:signal peptide [Streptococcus pneumoniae]|nr:signal peptide [Streptococcus pneumoniae]